MHDPKKELEALQVQLEAQEDWFQKELDSAKRMIGQQPDAPAAVPAAAPAAAPVRNYANNYGEKTIQFDIPGQTAVSEAPVPRKGIGRLVIIALLELAGIAGIAAYWILVLLK